MDGLVAAMREKLGNPCSIETGEVCNLVADENGEDGYSTRISEENSEYQIQRFTIADYKENAYEMEWGWGTKIKLDTPIEIVVK